MRTAILIIGLMGAIALGCSGGPGDSNPLTPSFEDVDIENARVAEHVLWGVWEVTLNPTGRNSAEVELIPLRGATFNCNVQRFLSPPYSPVDLITFEVLPDTSFPSGYVDMKVGLQHPFPGLPKYRGFDVRGVFMSDGNTIGEHDSAVLYSKPPMGGGIGTQPYMLNPDGYTRWWNATEFTDPLPLLSFKPASHTTHPAPSATLNPYKYFCDGLEYDDDLGDYMGFIVENRGSFAASGSVNSRRYTIQFPTDPAPEFRFNYAIDASYAYPDPSGAPDYPLDSFPPEAQTQEPYHLSAWDSGSDAYLFNGYSGGNLRVAVEVFDWQGPVNSNGVAGEISALWLEGEPLAAPVDAYPTATVSAGSAETSAVFEIEIDESFLNIQSCGEFTLLGTIESAQPSDYMPQIPGGENFVYPESAALAAYFMVDVAVTDRQMIVYCADGPAMGRQIYSIDPQGVGLPRQWTNGTDAFIECPKLSPCGRYILYTSCGLDFHSDLIIIDVTTGDETIITPSGNDAVYGDFSHDSTKIVGAIGTFGWPLDLWTMDYDGGNPTQLTHGADAWAPEYNFDDSKIYYSEFMSSQIFICDAATGDTEQYTDNGTWNDNPVGSPDGSQIAWATMHGLSTGRHIYISPVESWYPPDKEIGFETYIRSPCFSPDGTKLIFDHGGMAASELAIYDLQNDTWWDITDNPWGDYMADWAHMVPY